MLLKNHFISNGNDPFTVPSKQAVSPFLTVISSISMENVGDFISYSEKELTNLLVSFFSSERLLNGSS